MKKLLVFLLAALLAVSLFVSCGSEDTNSSADSSSAPSGSDPEQTTLPSQSTEDSTVTAPNVDVTGDLLYPVFENPAADMTSKPLWFWNTDLDSMTTDMVREIVRESYLQSGYSGFGILPYWQADYLSDHYFELYEAALDEGAKYGMHFSLYDENGFPSYTAGGLFAKKYPDLTAKRLDMVEASRIKDGSIFLKIPQGTFMGAVAWNPSTGEMINISDRAVIVSLATFDPATQPVGAWAPSTYDEAPGYGVDKAFDGDKNTRWNAYQHSGGGTYILVTYENEETVDEVRLWEDRDPELQRIQEFSVQIWDAAGESWKTVASGTTVTNTGASVTFEPVKTRFVRLVFDTVVRDSATVSEIEICAGGKALPAPKAISNDTADSSFVYSSSSDFSAGYAARFAFDGDPSTRWNAKDGQKTNQWLCVEFAEERKLDGVKVQESISRVNDFAIQYKKDGKWVDLVTGKTLGENYSITFDEISTTAIRLLMKSVTSDTATIAEFTPCYGDVPVWETDDDRENYNGSYVEYKVPGEGWKLMAFVTVVDGKKGIDYLSEEAVRGFIEITHEAYYARFKKYFDNGTITSAFYDEPCFWPSNQNYGVDGARMWTGDFNEVFARMFGTEIDPVLYYPAMFYDIGEKTAEARDKLMAVRTEMFAKHYIGQMNEWCEAHGIQLMGHMNCEDVESPLAYDGDLMYAFKYQSIPSVDVIYSYGMTEDYYKVISSSAYNWDKALVGVECYGASGETMPVKDLYKTAMDLFAKGINVMVPHAVWYSNTQNVVFPPELSYRNPFYADELPKYNRYIARLATMLQKGRHVSDIAVLYPIDTMEAAYLFNGSYNIPADSNYVALTDLLSTGLRLDFTYLHPSVLDEKVSVQGSQLHLDNAVNYEDYRVMIMPSMSVISLSNLTKIYAFYKAGGTVISVGTLPSAATVAEENEAVVKMITEMFGTDPEHGSDATIEKSNEAGGKLWHVATVKELSGLMGEALTQPDVSISSVREKNGHFTYIHKVVDDRNVWFFANSSETKVTPKISLRGSYELEVWNPMTGERSPLTTVKENGTTVFELPFDAVTSLFVVEKTK